MRAPCCSRRCSTWRTITSRKEIPSFTSISDLARVIPMLVPSPPLSFSTTTWSSGTPSAAGSSAASGNSVERLDLGLADHALLALSQQPLVVCESLDCDFGKPLRPHLLRRAVHRRDPMRCPAGRVLRADRPGDPHRRDERHAQRARRGQRRARHRLLRVLEGLDAADKAADADQDDPRRCERPVRPAGDRADARHALLLPALRCRPGRVAGLRADPIVLHRALLHPGLRPDRLAATATTAGTGSTSTSSPRPLAAVRAGAYSRAGTTPRPDPPAGSRSRPARPRRTTSPAS